MQLVVQPYYATDSSPVDGWGEWDDEVRDKKLDCIIEKINAGHIFTKPEWLAATSLLI